MENGELAQQVKRLPASSWPGFNHQHHISALHPNPPGVIPEHSWAWPQNKMNKANKKEFSTMGNSDEHINYNTFLLVEDDIKEKIIQE